MNKHSLLASLFRLPGSDDINGTASLAGLQTRAQVNSLVQARLGRSGQSAQSVLQQRVQAAQAQLSELKNKAIQYGSGSFGSSSDIDMPDFKPNTQTTKSFLRRLEWGTNLQTQKGTRYFPVTSDIGVSVGYKLNDKSVIGVGTSYKLGWGSGWNNIELTHQGIGLRSFIDYKLKRGLSISGGYEQNYRTAFGSID